jgi:UDP-N-acetylmuramate dehydrogenase
MIFQQKQSLKPFNTFGIDAQASFFATFSNEDELVSLLKKHQSPLLILGGGSNMLLTKDYEGSVLKNEILGIDIVEENDKSVLVKIGGGVVWHDLVCWSIDNGFGGIENLSLIPGSVGAAPIQNIGAYGVELKDCFHSLEGIHIESLEKKSFHKEDCQFGYRYSIFKGELKGAYVITSVTLQLSKEAQVNTSYGAIEGELKKRGIKQASIADVSQAIISIRQSKLPDPKEIGNSGSFFKNPVISNTQFEALQKQHPAIVGYTVSETETKVAAGWLIEQAGWKGYREGDAGVHHKQALVLVNYDSASGNDIRSLAEKIQHSIKEKFNISLEAEVNYI